MRATEEVSTVRIDANRAAELRKRNRLTQAEQFALQQYDVRAFYRLPSDAVTLALAQLLELDDYGKLRGRVRRYEHPTEPDDLARARAEPNDETPPLQGDRQHPFLRREFYQRLGEVVGVTPETEGAGLRSEITTLETERLTATTRRCWGRPTARTMRWCRR